MIVSRLRIENRASEFAVPDLVIADREILYESPVHFTPLRSEALVDGEALRTLLLEEYKAPNAKIEESVNHWLRTNRSTTVR